MYIFAYLHDMNVIEYMAYLIIGHRLQKLDILHNGKS